MKTFQHWIDQQVHNVNLTISAVRPEQYPDAKLPEVALAGRSKL